MRKKILLVTGLTWALTSAQVINAETNQDAKQQQTTSHHLEYETDAQIVLAHIVSSQALKQQLPAFIAEANNAISAHRGAIPSALALRMADSIRKANTIRSDLFKQALKHRSALYRIDAQSNDQERINEIIIAMSAATTLYENHQTMRDAFNAQDLLREKLNEAYPELGVESGFYQSSVARADKYEYRKAMADAIKFFNDNQDVIHQHIAESSQTIQTLTQHISQSRLLKTYQGSHVINTFLTLPKKVAHRVGTLPKESLKNLKFNSSKVLGNSLGLVRWRDGKLKNDTSLMQSLIAQLQPGDILLEKTPFTLTDKTIPGHFGHAAIYTGSAQQLKNIGAKMFSSISKNWPGIESGAGVVEALRDGVQLNKLEDFMNIDDIAVLRAKQITPEQQINAVSLALDNLGKRYDFNFDVNTTETIVCSELIYIAYPNIDFVTKRVLNSYTISPDDIAQQAGQEAKYPLELVMFVHNGQLVLDQEVNNEGHALYASLVRPQKNTTLTKNEPAFFNGFLAKH